MDIEHDFRELGVAASKFLSSMSMPFKISKDTARFDELKSLIKEMKTGRPIFVAGMYRIGKTSIMKAAISYFPGSIQLHSGDDLRTSIGWVPGDKELESIKDHEKRIERYFEKYKRAYVMLDEWNYFRGQEAELIRLVSKYKRFIIGFAGASYYHYIGALLKDFREIGPVYVRPPSHSDAEKVIKAIFYGKNVAIEDSAREYLLKETNYLPFLFVPLIDVIAELVVENPTDSKLRELSIESKNKYVITENAVRNRIVWAITKSRTKIFIVDYTDQYPIMRADTFQLENPLAQHFLSIGLIEKVELMGDIYRLKGEFVRFVAK